MKIIDAFWEERNLGLKVCEIIFDINEFLDVDKILELEKSYDYIVAKVPGDCVDMVQNLERHQFRYLENQQIVYVSTEELSIINEEWRKRFQNIYCKKVSCKTDLKFICDQIRKGLYIKGRISADPDIEPGISDLRIVNWLNDLAVKENVLICKLVKDESIIGYFALEKIDGIHFNVVQAGIFRDYQNQGFSFLIPYYILRMAKENKIKGVFASISSNNIDMLNSISKFIHLSFRKTYVVMRKKISEQTISLHTCG
jgi:hypothetical protein